MSTYVHVPYIYDLVPFFDYWITLPAISFATGYEPGYRYHIESYSCNLTTNPRPQHHLHDLTMSSSITSPNLPSTTPGVATFWNSLMQRTMNAQTTWYLCCEPLEHMQSSMGMILNCSPIISTTMTTMIIWKVSERKLRLWSDFPVPPKYGISSKEWESLLRCGIH